ncbi:hypothetical protein, partial [Escherichia coli]|uniref:hypothetical protein n=1 Tax=Escherichia coli TaxID=562 RepID=UPI001CDA6467
RALSEHKTLSISWSHYPTDTDKNSTYLPAQSEPECYTAPAAVNVTDNSYSTALIHHHTTAAAV